MSQSSSEHWASCSLLSARRSLTSCRFRACPDLLSCRSHLPFSTTWAPAKPSESAYDSDTEGGAEESEGLILKLTGTRTCDAVSCSVQRAAENKSWNSGGTFSDGVKKWVLKSLISLLHCYWSVVFLCRGSVKTIPFISLIKGSALITPNRSDSYNYTLTVMLWYSSSSSSSSCVGAWLFNLHSITERSIFVTCWWVNPLKEVKWW